MEEREGKFMHTVSDVFSDIGRGCTANNMAEEKFSYRIIFFVNEGDRGTKHRVDTVYSGLKEALENIIRDNLSLTNSVVIAETTAMKEGRCVRLQSRPYAFSLEDYFRKLRGDERGNRNGSVTYARSAVR